MSEQPASDRAVQGLFRVWSRVYDSPLFQRPFYRRVHAALEDELDRLPASPEVVMDLGCGTCQLTRDLTARYPDAQVIGADMSADMLTSGRRNDDSFAALQANVYSLPLADDSIDLVTSTISYHWYLDYQQALAEIRRVLRPGGYFVLATLSSPLFGTGVRRAARSFGRQRIGRPGEIAGELTDAGFAIAQQRAVFPAVRVFVTNPPAMRPGSRP